MTSGTQPLAITFEAKPSINFNSEAKSILYIINAKVTVCSLGNIYLLPKVVKIRDESLYERI